jgi:hypothetical protein
MDKANQEFVFSQNNYGIDDIPKAKPRGRSAMTYNADRTKWAERERAVSKDAVFGKSARDLAKQYTAEAIATLAEIMRTADKHSVRESAAKALLDRGWGRPEQTIDSVGAPLIAFEVVAPWMAKDVTERN